MLHNQHLTPEELRRYSRHLTLPEFGMEGQKRLKRSSVLIIGAGGLGSPVALYLAAAGVGRIGLVDFDVVDETNLQRQVLYTTQDVGRPKVEVAAERLRALNPYVEIETYPVQLRADNALELIGQYDVVADGTDNFTTRYLVNDACVLTGTPNVYASIFRFEGQASVFATREGPCYRCLYPEPPPPGLVPSCAEGGVLGVLPGLLGTIQANEVIKVLTGIGEPLVGRLLLVDALTMHFQEMKLMKDPACPVCGEHPTITSLQEYTMYCGVPGNGQHTLVQEEVPEITVEELQEWLEKDAPPLLLDVREPFERAIVNIGGTFIPLRELPERLQELEDFRNHPVVVYCRSGVRSAQAVALLREAGFTQAFNLRGGILAWREQVDPTLPAY